jgi:hypothetical protein
MYGLALCLPRVGQPQGLPVPHEIPKTPSNAVEARHCLRQAQATGFGSYDLTLNCRLLLFIFSGHPYALIR